MYALTPAFASIASHADLTAVVWVSSVSAIVVLTSILFQHELQSLRTPHALSAT